MKTLEGHINNLSTLKALSNNKDCESTQIEPVLKCQSLQDVDHKVEFFQEYSERREGLYTLKPSQMNCILCTYMSNR